VRNSSSQASLAKHEQFQRSGLSIGLVHRSTRCAFQECPGNLTVERKKQPVVHSIVCDKYFQFQQCDGEASLLFRSVDLISQAMQSIQSFLQRSQPQSLPAQAPHRRRISSTHDPGASRPYARTRWLCLSPPSLPGFGKSGFDRTWVEQEFASPLVLTLVCYCTRIVCSLPMLIVRPPTLYGNIVVAHCVLVQNLPFQLSGLASFRTCRWIPSIAS
jgi:hypothetical protein